MTADLMEALNRSPDLSRSNTPTSLTPRSDRAEGHTPSRTQQPLSALDTARLRTEDDGSQIYASGGEVGSSQYGTAVGKTPASFELTARATYSLSSQII